VLGRRDDPALRVATYVGAGSVALSLIGFLFGGALVGEHLGQLPVIGWSVTLSVLVLRTGIQPRWLGVTVPRAPLPNPSASRPASAPPAAAGLRS
jgi:hypothetical protein